MSISRPRMPASSWGPYPSLLLREPPARLIRGRHRVVGRGERHLVERAIAQLLAAVAGAIRGGLVAERVDDGQHRDRRGQCDRAGQDQHAKRSTRHAAILPDCRCPAGGRVVS
jgi:hypothetical protein